MGLLPFLVTDAPLEVAGSGVDRRPYLSLWRSHSTPWLSGSSAAILAHSSSHCPRSLVSWAPPYFDWGSYFGEGPLAPAGRTAALGLAARYGAAVLKVNPGQGFCA